MKEQKINHAAVWILVILYQIASVSWYKFFNEKWMTLNGFSILDFKDQSWGIYVVSVATSAITFYFLAWLFKRIAISGAATGAKFAFLVWLALIFTNVLAKDLFSLRPFTLTLINEGVNAVAFLCAGALLGLWKQYDK